MIRRVSILVFVTILRIVLMAGILYGVLCIFGEADPWTLEAQVKLFVKGILIIGICAAVIGITENVKEDER